MPSSTDGLARGSLVATRRALHGVAELLLAGPQYRRSGTIRLRISGAGFATVGEPQLRLEAGPGGADLVAGDLRVPVGGATCAELAAAACVDVGAAVGVYHDGSGVAPDETLTVDHDAADDLVRGFAIGDAALRQFAPEAEPVLWPEHFDVGLAVAEVNYGVSPGDGYLGEPYAYVGPWRARRGEFWNAPFGAARPVRELGDADAVRAFFTAGSQSAERDAAAG